MTDEVEQDSNDLRGGFKWANMWQTCFFVMECLVMIVSLAINMCLLRATARNSSKEASVIYMALIFFFFTSLVDDGVIIESFMSLYGHQVHSTQNCRFATFVAIGNKLLQALAVIALLYYSLAMIELKSKRIENAARRYMPFGLLMLIVLEVIFTLPPTMNIRGSVQNQFCLYVDDNLPTLRLTRWLFYVLFPYYIPLMVSVYPLVKISLKLRQPDGLTQRDRNQYQIVMVIGFGYFLFHFLYYLLFLGREIEGSMLSKSAFRHLLGLHVWYIARPLFALLNYGWHIVTPLAPFIFDTDLVKEFPGPLVNKNRRFIADSNRCEDIVLEDRPYAESTHKVSKNEEWTEIHNPLPTSLEDDREYHQVPL